MYIYYYYQDGFYYVMNELGILKQYSAINNIEMILNLENMIAYLQKIDDEEPNQFYFKTIQECNGQEIAKAISFLTPILMTEYSILGENALPNILIQASIINLLNFRYAQRKNRLPKQDDFYDYLLKEHIQNLKMELKNIKNISHCHSNIVPLSELNFQKEKIYLPNVENLLTSIQDDIDVELEANFLPNDFFGNDIYDKCLEMDLYTEEFEYSKKVKIAQKKYLKTQSKEIEQKLKAENLRNKMQKQFYLANGLVIGDMTINILLNGSQNNWQNYLTLSVILMNVYLYSKYHNEKKELDKTPDKILKLEKK